MSEQKNKVGWPVMNGFAPAWARGAGGPKAFPIDLDFSGAVTEAHISMLIAEDKNQIDYVQGMFVDNSQNAAALTFLWEVTLHRVVVPAGAQGVFPVIAPRTNVKAVVTTTAGGGENIKIIRALLLNVPMPFQLWGAAVSLVVGASSLTIVPTQVAMTGASVPLLAANAARKYVYIGNPPTNANPIYVQFGAAAVIGAGNAILPGGSLTMTADGVSIQAINAIGTNLEVANIQEG